MNATLQYIADLERVNYVAMLAVAQVTPGLDLIIRDDVIITSSQTFPAPDTTHACLLRATPRAADDLIAEVIDHFESRNLPTSIFVSPACAPADLTGRLLSRGFVQQEASEAWLVLEDLQNFAMPATTSNVAVKLVTRDQVTTFAALFMAAFGMPVDFAPYMAQLLEPCIGLPGVYHYLACVDGQPIGTCSILCYENFGILGSAGVLPDHRRGGAATALAVQAATQALGEGVDTLVLQTAAGAPLERLLRISGFKPAFIRTCYTLP
jgi:GNAT superfamily N-acetyltransferase